MTETIKSVAGKTCDPDLSKNAALDVTHRKHRKQNLNWGREMTANSVFLRRRGKDPNEGKVFFGIGGETYRTCVGLVSNTLRECLQFSCKRKERKGREGKEERREEGTQSA